MTFFKSLKGRLISIFFTLILILGIVTFVFFNISNNGQKELILKGYAENVKTLSKQIAAQFYERYGDVQAFAQNSVLESKNEKSIQLVFDEYVKLYGIYDLIIYVDLNGRYVSSNTTTTTNEKVNIQALRSRNFAEDNWFKEAVRENWTKDEKRGFDGTFFEDAVMDPLIETSVSRKEIGSSFTTIVKNSRGEKIGIISNRANFKWVETEFQLLYETLKENGFPQSEIQLLNKNGFVIVDFDPFRNGDEKIHHDYENVLLKLNLVTGGVKAAEDVHSGKSGHGETFHLRKKVVQLAGWTPISERKFIDAIGWGLLLRSPSEVFFKNLVDQQRIFWIAVLTVILISMIIAYLYLTKISNRMSGFAHEILNGTKSVRNTSSQVSSSSQIVAEASSQSSNYIQETTSSMEQILNIVKLNSQNSLLAKELSENSKSSANKGDAKIESLFGSIKKIEKSSKEIKDISNVIDDIAFQTNLLALNAAVEAARAGEQGKGFAVVADAVRNLAQKSSVAAKEISGLIQESGDNVELGVTMTSDTSEVYKDIILKVNETASLVNQIAETGTEQEKGVDQVSKAMHSLDQETQKNAVTAEELSATASELSTQAEILDQLTLKLMKYIEG